MTLEAVRIDVRGAPEGGFSLVAGFGVLHGLLLAFIGGTMLSIPFFIAERYEYAVFPISAAVVVWAWWSFVRPRRAEAKLRAYGRSLGEIRAALRRLRSGAYRFRHLWLAFNFAAAIACYIIGFGGFTDAYRDPAGIAMIVFVLNGLRLWSDKAGFLKTALAWALIGAVWIGVVALWGEMFADQQQNDLMGTLGLIALILGVGAALFLTRRIAPWAQASMEEMRKRDPRPPVLFLRSFNDEAEPILGDRGGPRLERVVADCVRPYGPFIGIGRPGELRPSGAARTYFADDAWQAAVLKLMDEAALIVVLPGLTPGLDWEMGQLTKAGRLRKTMFVFAPTEGPARFARLRQLLADTPEGARLAQVDLSLAISLHLTRDWRWAVAYANWTSFATYQAGVDIAAYGLLCADA